MTKRFGPFMAQMIKAAAHYADALLLAEDPHRAGDILDQVPEEKRDGFWHLRHAQAIGGAGGTGAVDCIDRGITLIKLPKYRATFLAVKADLLRAAGNPDAVAVPREAVASCEDEQYRTELQERLDQWTSN